jgi:hypothetical protein
MSLQAHPFFECSPDADYPIAGKYPQIDYLFGRGSNIPIRDFISKLRPEKWENVPNVALSLSRGAKWTDFISSGLVPNYVGLLVSTEAQDLLQQFRLPAHRWIPTKIVGQLQQGKQREERPYAILNFGDSDADAIDYPSSAFYHVIEEIPLHFDSLADWIAFARQSSAPPLIRFTRLVLAEPLDIFSIPFDATVIVSERLKNAIEESSLVGFKFEPMTRMEVMMNE